jgi:hypothetical protein
MKLAVVSFFVAFVAAPLAAQAAQSPARYAVTLVGSVQNAYKYEQASREEECLVRREGAGARELKLQSVQPTAMHVVRGRNGGAVYRPAALGVVRVNVLDRAGSYTEVRQCRGEPIRRVTGDCNARRAPARRIRADFRRPSPGAIRFRTPTPLGASAALCGLTQRVQLAGGLHLATGRVGERALLSGRSRRIVARGSLTRELSGPAGGDPNLTVTQRVTIRWTLTFRRLG